MQHIEWGIKEVDERLERTMTAAYSAVHDEARRRKTSLRLGALVLAIDRVAKATRMRGI
jgi:glutamate dehydrogenase/leucine dehydrogenase